MRVVNSASGSSPHGDFLLRLNKQLRKLHNEICLLDEQKWFHYPVSVGEAGEEYLIVIEKPMDLSKMGERIASGFYRSVQEYKQDFDIIIGNAKLYNEDGSDPYIAAESFDDVCREVFLDFEARMKSRKKYNRTGIYRRDRATGAFLHGVEERKRYQADMKSRLKAAPLTFAGHKKTVAKRHDTMWKEAVSVHYEREKERNVKRIQSKERNRRRYAVRRMIIDHFGLPANFRYPVARVGKILADAGAKDKSQLFDEVLSLI